jgi:predicted RNase H-like nuclease (RuvC/YqgF family)
MSDEIKIKRLQRKLDQRKDRIAGLERRIAKLESSLALRSGDAVVVNAATLRRDIEAAVTEALCNVRMIPVHNISAQRRIVEVRSIKETPE